MLSFAQLSVQATYRWIYGLLIYLFILFSTDQLFVPHVNPDQIVLGATIFIIQYCLFNILFSAWIAMKKNLFAITILGFILDLTLIAGTNYIFGADRLELLFFFLIPLFFSISHKWLNTVIYIVSLLLIGIIFYVKNGAQLFFTMEVLRYVVLSYSLYTLFFLIIKYVIHNTYLEAIRKVAMLFHEIRNSLTVILGYINLLNNEKVTDEQRQFFYQSIESATQRIKSLCDQYITQKKNSDQQD